MNPLKRPRKIIGLILFSYLFVFFLYFIKAFYNFELITYDARFQLRPVEKVSDDVVIIEIADETLKNLGHWPLPRDFHASLVNVLREFKVKRIIFDVLFSEKAIHDLEFAASIRNAGNVYLPAAFYLDESLSKTEDYFLISDNLLADITPELKKYIKGSGHINVLIDSDGKVRRVPLFINFKGALYPQLGLMAAIDELSLDINKLKQQGNSLIIDEKLSLPLMKGGAFLVDYPGEWGKAFKHYSYFEILKSYSQLRQGQSPVVDLQQLGNKTCFIGLTATGTTDLRPTPLSNAYPMIGLQASVYNNIIEHRFIKYSGFLLNLLIGFLILTLSLIFCIRFSPVKAFFSILSLAVIFGLIAFLLFMFPDIWIDLFLPLFILAVVYISVTSYKFFNEVRSRELIENELDIARKIQQSFLPQAVNETPGIEIASFIQPAKFVAGDLFDIFKIDSARMGIFIADVSGKGVPAALIMAQTISLFRIYSRQITEADKVLEKLNEQLCGKFEGRFVTALFMIINNSSGRVEVSSAGHEPLLFYKNSGNTLVSQELDSGLPLGIMEGVKYQSKAVNFAKNDKLIVFTDGLSEARDLKNKEFGIEEIKKIIQGNTGLSAKQLLAVLKEKLEKFSAGASQHDDITLIIAAKS